MPWPVRLLKKGAMGNILNILWDMVWGWPPMNCPASVPAKADLLKPGMVVTIEPGIYLPGWGGVRLENMAVIQGKRG